MRSFLQKYKRFFCTVAVATLCVASFTGVITGRAGVIMSADSEGNISWENEPTMATTGTRWETQGYLIYASKTKDGDPLSSGKPYARIEIDNRYVRNETKYDRAKGKYITKNIIDAEYIKKAISDNEELYSEFMKNVGKGKPYIYLNAFFRTYRIDGVGNKTILSKNLYSRAEISSDQNWGNKHEWDEGRGYYNVEVGYKVTGNVTVKMLDSSGNELAPSYKVFGNDDKFVGDTVNIRLPLETVSGGKVYRLYRSYCYDSPSSTKKKDDTRYNDDAFGTENKTIKLGLQGDVVVGRYREDGNTGESKDCIEGYLTEPEPYAGILSDTFDVTKGIPGGESVYTVCSTPSYLLGYRFDNKAGYANYTAYGQITWNLSWTEGEGDDEVTMESSVVMTYPASIARSYSYWDIEYLDVYALNGSDIHNAAMENDSVSVCPSGTYPKVNVRTLGEVSSHVRKPAECEGVIDLGVRSFAGNTPPPVDVYYEINSRVGECRVCNDLLVINGVTVMDANEARGSTAAPKAVSTDINASTLRVDGINIPTIRANGQYRSSGEVSYSRVAGVNSARGDVMTVAIDSVNSVVVHTPVVCKAYMEDAKEFCELIDYDRSRKQLVIDRYFKVGINETGDHRNIKGYGHGNYGKYSAVTEVMFPFDVETKSELIRSGTWHTLNGEEQFYIPVYVNEGEYSVTFRSVSANTYANNGIFMAERNANTDTSNYVAFDAIPVYVSGRIYDLMVTRVNGTSVKKPIGTKDRNGEKSVNNVSDTAPMVPGELNLDHSEGPLKKGYRFDLSVVTVGDYEQEYHGVKIKPSYYVISRDGTNRIPVDVYRTDKDAISPILLTRERSVGSENDNIIVWNGSYELPCSFYVVPHGFDINGYSSRTGVFDHNESFFIKKGYLLICFDVTSLQGGREVLSLTADLCNMWKLQGGVKDKVDRYGNRFSFAERDFILYDLEKNLNDDSSIVAIY